MLVNMKEMLADARQRHYAVGLFNSTDSDMLQGVLEAAENLRAPLVIGTAEVLLPYGELKLIAPSIIAAAKRATVPVAVHYDHGLTFERCMEALQLGFSSIMFDGSAHDMPENLRATCEMVKIAHAMGVTVEGEIGHVGDVGDGSDEGSDLYTTPQQALDFANATGVDALAVAIGTAHGAYRKKPKLDIERLKEIRREVDVPLVLHGGSGLSDDDFRNAISAGISKVNIFTDICLAGDVAVREAMAEGLGYLERRNRKVEHIRRCVENKIKLFGADGKA